MPIRRIGLVACVAAVLGAAAIGWPLHGHSDVVRPTGAIVYSRLVERNRVTSLDGIQTLSLRSDLYIVPAAGGRPRLLARNASQAAVSPDGSRIVFSRGEDVWTMRRDGSGQRLLVRQATTPAFSADGNRLYVSRWVGADNGNSLFAVPSGGGQPLRLTRARGTPDDPERPHGCFQYHAHPSAAPDGRTLAFTDTANACAPGDTIRVVALDRRPLPMPFRLHAVPNDPPFAHDPAFSPDGRQLAYAFGLFDKSDIYLSRADRSPTTRLAIDGDGPAWSPDGRFVAYRLIYLNRYPANSSIALTRADGSGHPQLVAEPATCRNLSRVDTAPPSRCVSLFDPAWLPAAS